MSFGLGARLRRMIEICLRNATLKLVSLVRGAGAPNGLFSFVTCSHSEWMITVDGTIQAIHSRSSKWCRRLRRSCRGTTCWCFAGKGRDAVRLSLGRTCSLKRGKHLTESSSSCSKCGLSLIRLSRTTCGTYGNVIDSRVACDIKGDCQLLLLEAKTARRPRKLQAQTRAKIAKKKC